MTDIAKPFTDEKNQFVFCIFGFLWVSNIGPLLSGQTFILRVLIYPIYILLIILFAKLLFGFKKNKPYIDNTAYNIFLCLVVLGCVCLVRGIPLHMNIGAIRDLLFNLHGAAIVWVMPFSIFFSIKARFWTKWLPKLRFIVFLGTVYVFTLLLSGISRESLLEHNFYNSTDLLFIAPFLTIWSRLKKDSADLLLGCLGTAALVVWMFLKNERFAISYAGLMWLFYLTAITFEKYSLNLKVNLLGLCLGGTIIFSVFFSQVPIFKTYINKYIFQGAILEDTRGGGRLADAVTRDMSYFEKCFGKGIDGTYIFGMIGWPPQPYIRSNVEIGHKQLVLKGGYLMQIAFLGFSLYAVYLAIFRSNNRITRYLSYIIIARLIIMTTAMPPRIGFEYFMYWLVVGGCLSTELRSLSDDEIVKECSANRITIKW